MLCFKCGVENDDNTKYCSKCNALLPKAAPTGNPQDSDFDLEEDVHYPLPEVHYESPILQHLAWSVHEFVEEEGEMEPIVEAYEAFREVFEGFRVDIPKVKDFCYEGKNIIEGDPMPGQIKYMVIQAEQFFNEGESMFEEYLDKLEELDEDEDFPDPSSLIEATKKWLSCNDCICIAYEFLMGREQLFGELLEEANQMVEEEKKAAAKAQAEGNPTNAPSDSIDLA